MMHSALSQGYRGSHTMLMTATWSSKLDQFHKDNHLTDAYHHTAHHAFTQITVVFRHTNTTMKNHSLSKPFCEAILLLGSFPWWMPFCKAISKRALKPLLRSA